MNKQSKWLNCLALFFVLNISSLQAIIFDGGGDGTTWEDPLNWDTDAVPTNATNIDIPAGFNVVVTMPGQLSDDIDILDGASLTINVGADLLADDDVHIRDNSSLIVNGSFFVRGSLSDGIDIVDDGTLINNGLIEIGDIVGSASFSDNAIEMGSNSSIINNGTMNIDMDDDGDIALYLDSNGASFTNAGILNISNGGDENIETDAGTTFINTATGVITLNTADFQNLESDGDFTNDGQIIINADSGSSSGLDHYDEGTFTNNGSIIINGDLGTSDIINISGPFINNGIITNNATTTGRAVDLSNGTSANGSITNTACGIFNMGSTIIHLTNNTNSITNDGIMTSSFAAAHENDGTITNNGQIHSPAATFTAAPNAVVGVGTILGAPIPAATTLCAVTVPTLNEWGLILLTLLLLNLAVLILLARRKEMSSMV